MTKKRKNILALSPHADDVEISMGGTIAKLVEEGNNVTIITAIFPKENTDGKIDDLMSKNRRKEQEKAAKILGANLEILNIDPYDFSVNRKYIKLFDKKIHSYNPDIIFCSWNHDSHQDHKILANILFSVARKNNISINMYEAILPGSLNTYAFNPQYYINISKYIDVKIEALKAYKSVFGKEKKDYNKYFESIIRGAKFRGKMIGVDCAEAFVIVKKIEI